MDYGDGLSFSTWSLRVLALRIRYKGDKHG